MKLKIFFHNYLLFNLEFQFRDLILMEKIPNTPHVSVTLHLKFGGFGIGYGIGQLGFRLGIGCSLVPATFPQC